MNATDADSATNLAIDASASPICVAATPRSPAAFTAAPPGMAFIHDVDVS